MTRGKYFGLDAQHVEPRPNEGTPSQSVSLWMASGALITGSILKNDDLALIANYRAWSRHGCFHLRQTSKRMSLMETFLILERRESALRREIEKLENPIRGPKAIDQSTCPPHQGRPSCATNPTYLSFRIGPPSFRRFRLGKLAETEYQRQNAQQVRALGFCEGHVGTARTPSK